MTIDLATYFDQTVAAGWAPRHPCVDFAEMATLEQSAVRGDCISPLLRAGDVIYIDRSARPEPGDVVSFALSRRGAEVQNSALPPGQSPWSPGSRWCKVYGIEHGFQMLYDRHGGAATATLLTCESPDDVPVLHPVRNILRNGRMLFGSAAPAAPMIQRRGVLLGALGGLALSACNADGINIPELPAASEPLGDNSGAQVGANAATTIATASLSTVNVGFVNVNVVTINVPAMKSTATIIATAVFDMVVNTGTFGGNAFLNSVFYSASSSSCLVTATQGQLRFTIQMEFAGNVGDAPDISLVAHSANTSGTALTVSNVVLQIEQIKR